MDVERCPLSPSSLARHSFPITGLSVCSPPPAPPAAPPPAAPAAPAAPPPSLCAHSESTRLSNFQSCPRDSTVKEGKLSSSQPSSYQRCDINPCDPPPPLLIVCVFLWHLRNLLPDPSSLPLTSKGPYYVISAILVFVLVQFLFTDFSMKAMTQR